MHPNYYSKATVDFYYFFYQIKPNLLINEPTLHIHTFIIIPLLGLLQDLIKVYYIKTKNKYKTIIKIQRTKNKNNKNIPKCS